MPNKAEALDVEPEPPLAVFDPLQVATTQDPRHSPVAVLTCACRVNAPRNALHQLILTAALIVGLAAPAVTKWQGGGWL